MSVEHTQSQNTPQIRLKRIAPGEYETRDGRWSISRRRASEDYGGREEWFAVETRHAYHAGGLDPVPTLREVRSALAASYATEAEEAA